MERRLDTRIFLGSQEFVDVPLNPFAKDQATSADLHALNLAAHNEFVRRGPANPQHRGGFFNRYQHWRANVRLAADVESTDSVIVLLRRETKNSPSIRTSHT